MPPLSFISGKIIRLSQCGLRLMEQRARVWLCSDRDLNSDSGASKLCDHGQVIEPHRVSFAIRSSSDGDWSRWRGLSQSPAPQPSWSCPSQLLTALLGVDCLSGKSGEHARQHRHTSHHSCACQWMLASLSPTQFPNTFARVPTGLSKNQRLPHISLLFSLKNIATIPQALQLLYICGIGI